MANIYYLIAPVGHKSKSGLVGYFWLMVSYEAVVKLSAWAASSEGLTRVESFTSKLFTCPAIGRRPQFLSPWPFPKGFLGVASQFGSQLP